MTVLPGNGMCMTHMVNHNGHAYVSRFLLVSNICPAITESTAPYPHLSSLLIVLYIPLPEGDEFSPMQDPSHTQIKSHCILGLLTFLPVGLPVTW
jgi:hypothetical protein